MAKERHPLEENLPLRDAILKARQNFVGFFPILNSYFNGNDKIIDERNFYIIYSCLDRVLKEYEITDLSIFQTINASSYDGCRTILDMIAIDLNTRILARNFTHNICTYEDITDPSTQNKRKIIVLSENKLYQYFEASPIFKSICFKLNVMDRIDQGEELTSKTKTFLQSFRPMDINHRFSSEDIILDMLAACVKDVKIMRMISDWYGQNKDKVEAALNPNKQENPIAQNIRFPEEIAELRAKNEALEKRLTTIEEQLKFALEFIAKMQEQTPPSTKMEIDSAQASKQVNQGPKRGI
jgi:hypothetical protein